MRILFDGRSLQVRQHKSDGLRLRDLIEKLTAEPLSADVDIGLDVPLSEQDLSLADVLVIPTRGPRFPYTPVELTVVEHFVRGGRGLLLLANHANCPGNNVNLAKQDAVAAACFGLHIEEAWFKNKVGLLTIPVRALEHPVLNGPFGVVRSIVVNNCTSILTTNAVGLAPLPSVAEDGRNGWSPADRYALIAANPGKGRVVIGADSGICGSQNTTRPGPGLIHEADNRAMLVNAIAWLAVDGGTGGLLLEK